jgi:hypothetical protein
MSAAGGNVLISWRRHKGIILGHPRINGAWYRFKVGRHLAIGSARHLPREWVLAYVRWHRMRGERDKAIELQRKWLAAPKERAS